MTDRKIWMYTNVSAESLPRLEEKVQSVIAHAGKGNWIPLGGVCIDPPPSRQYIQTMVLYAPANYGCNKNE
jgi:hypothetical protein